MCFIIVNKIKNIGTGSDEMFSKNLNKMFRSSKFKLLPLVLSLPLPIPLKVNADDEGFLNT